MPKGPRQQADSEFPDELGHPEDSDPGQACSNCDPAIGLFLGLPLYAPYKRLSYTISLPDGLEYQIF